jgi:hypothetical protein
VTLTRSGSFSYLFNGFFPVNFQHLNDKYT